MSMRDPPCQRGLCLTGTKGYLRQQPLKVHVLDSPALDSWILSFAALDLNYDNSSHIRP